MAGLLDTIKDKAKQVYSQGLLNQVITNPASVGQELSQIFDPSYMSQVRPMSQQTALDVALSAPMMAGTIKNVGKNISSSTKKPIVSTFNGKNLNKPLLDKFIKTNKLSPEEFAIYEDNAQKMAQQGLHNINIANAKANPYYEKYKSMFNADIYRGMRDDVASMNPNVGTGARQDTGIWASNVPYNASTYAGYNDGGVVYPLKVRSQEFATVDVGNKNWNRIPISNNPIEDTIIRNADQTDIPLSDYVDTRYDDWIDTNTIASIAKQNPKNKGIIFENVRDIGGASQGVDLNKVQEFSDTYTIFDPSFVRSKFAAFDPLRYKSNDILAGVVAAPIGLLNVEDKKKRK